MAHSLRSHLAHRSFLISFHPLSRERAAIMITFNRASMFCLTLLTHSPIELQREAEIIAATSSFGKKRRKSMSRHVHMVRKHFSKWYKCASLLQYRHNIFYFFFNFSLLSNEYTLFHRNHPCFSFNFYSVKLNITFSK